MTYIIKQYGNPILRTRTRPVSQVTRETYKIADKLRFAMLKNPAYGIAANQLGFDKSICVYSFEKNHNQILINPRILDASKEMVTQGEGCLSLPGYTFQIARPKSITIEALTLKEDTITIEAEGMLARILHHEIDHLSGVLLIGLLDQEHLEEFEKEWLKRRNK